jgi:hypothetical protein
VTKCHATKETEITEIKIYLVVKIENIKIKNKFISEII